jgi:hypothetical protein
MGRNQKNKPTATTQYGKWWGNQVFEVIIDRKSF